MQANRLAALAPEEPVSVLLAWIDVESSGSLMAGNASNGGLSSADERGLFQIQWADRDGSPSEAQEKLHLTKEEFNRLTTDGDWSVLQGVRLVKAYENQADKLLASLKITWPRNSWDYWGAVKLLHALPSVAKELFRSVNSAFGPPDSWTQFYTEANHLIGNGSVGPLAKRMGSKVLATTDRMLALAEKDNSPEPPMVRL